MPSPSLFKLPSVYLASASPRRHEILTLMGVDHHVLHVPAPEGEDEPQHPGEAPEIYVQRTAREKALRAIQWLASGSDALLPVSQGLGSLWPVLSADTTVILDKRILGKPGNADEAREMLGRLSGRSHYVHTAVVIARGDMLLEDVSITEVTFRALDTDEINAYCATGEPMGKAGAYGIQGSAGMFVQSIHGSYTGVMGLPMYETANLLRVLD